MDKDLFIIDIFKLNSSYQLQFENWKPYRQLRVVDNNKKKK